MPSVMPRDLIVCSTRSFVLRCARGCVCASIPSHVLHLARHAHQSLHSASEKSVDRSSPTTCLLSCPTTSIELLHPRRPVREVKSKVKSRASAVASSIFDSFSTRLLHVSRTKMAPHVRLRVFKAKHEPGEDVHASLEVCDGSRRDVDASRTAELTRRRAGALERTCREHVQDRARGDRRRWCGTCGHVLGGRKVLEPQRIRKRIWMCHTKHLPRESRETTRRSAPATRQ